MDDGYYTDKKKSQESPSSLMRLLYPSTGNFIAVVSNFSSSRLKNHFKINMMKADIPVESLTAPESLVGVDFSDHRNYWEFDYPAVMVTNTAFYRNKAYHTEFDTYDRLNYQKMGEVIFGVYKYVMGVER